MYRYKFTR